jgi:hypothetical protein
MKMERFEIRDSKGKLVESLTKDTSQGQAVLRVKELKTAKPNVEYELVRVSTVYDTAKPPVEIEF